MANTIDFNVNTNAVTVLNQIDAAAENTAQGFSSAKAELRALQQQLLQMDSSSEEFKIASKRAAELKDNISDLSAEINANAGNAFEGLSNNVGLFGSRLMDLDLKGAGQALSGMGSAVARIDFKTMKEEIGGLIGGFFNLAKAIMANPILLLGGIIAAVVMNMDKLRKAMPGLDAAMGGLTEKMKAAAKANEASLKARQLEYDIINASTALMKEQGMSDKEILLVQKEKAKALLEQKKVTDAQNIANAKADLQRNENLKMVLKGIQEVGLAVPKLMAYVFDTIFAKTKELLSYVGVTIDTSIQAYDTIVDAQGLVLDTIFGNTAEQISAIQDMENQALLSQTQLANTIAQMGLDVKKIDEDNSKRAQTQFEKVESLGMKRIELNEKVVNNIVSQEDKLAKAIIDSQNKVEQHQKEILAKRVQMTSNAFDALSNLTMAFNAKSETAARNQFKLNKAFSLSQAIINTYQAVNAALTAGGNPAKLATGAQFVDAGIALTAGLANVIKIQQTKFGGTNNASGGGNLGGVGSGGGTTAPSPANYDFLNQQPNQQPPLQAYVVSTQVSSNLEAQQLINNQARLGG
jgi:hypothetical protein